MNFLPHFVPARLTFLGLAGVLPGVVTRFRQGWRPWESFLVGRVCSELSPDLPHSHQAFCSSCTAPVIHHSCHNPICANITNKARVGHLTQKHCVVTLLAGGDDKTSFSCVQVLYNYSQLLIQITKKYLLC